MWRIKRNIFDCVRYNVSFRSESKTFVTLEKDIMNRITYSHWQIFRSMNDDYLKIKHELVECQIEGILDEIC